MQPSMISEFKKFVDTVQKNPPPTSADFLSYLQKKGINLQEYKHEDLVAFADEIDLDEESREDFFEEVAGWL